MIKKIFPIAIFISFLTLLISGYSLYQSYNKAGIIKQKNIVSFEDEKRLGKDIVEEYERTNNMYTSNNDALIATYLSIKEKNPSRCNDIKNYNIDTKTKEDGTNICNGAIKNGKVDNAFIKGILLNHMPEDIAQEKIDLITIVFENQKSCEKIDRDIATYHDCKKLIDKNFDASLAQLNFTRLFVIPFESFKKTPQKYIKEFNLDQDILPVATFMLGQYDERIKKSN